MEQTHRISFEFLDNSRIDFNFTKPENESDVEELTNHIIDSLARKKKLVKSAFGKLIKKSNVVSHRKVVMAFYIGGKLISTDISNIEISNKICTSPEALTEAITILFADL